MKLRNTAAAAVAAFALVLSLPGSALAAQGNFTYKYVDGFGQLQHVALHDPQSGQCINLHVVGDEKNTAGYGPHNSTDSAVTLYRGAGCTGDQYRLRAHGNPARDDLYVRSVRFDVKTGS